MHFYPRLRDIREDRDLTQAEIADVLNTAREQYHKYETGKQEIPVHHLITLAKFYSVSVDFLLGLIDQPRTLDGSPYQVSKNYAITQTGNGTMNFQ